jgi:N-acetylglutamate synthase
MLLCLEEYAINAWPAQQTLLYDGWVLRFANGYTRRANSVNPLYPSALPLAEKIAACEALYFGQGLTACYKMNDASQPTGLDNALGAAGYSIDAPTSVQTLDLRARPPASPADDRCQVEIASSPTAEWKEEFARMTSAPPQRRAAHEQILAAILPAAGYAAVRQDGRLVACGLGVLQNGYLGLFDIITDPACRRQGHAMRLINALFAWAIGQNAHTSYLQVMLNNPPALNLYRELGFREAYQYWYRVKAPADR